MSRQTSETPPTPVDVGDNEDPTTLYALSYRKIRLWVGRLGFLLPTVLFLLDVGVLHDGIVFRGSLSAYYYSGGRDVFVGILGITGFMLIVYKRGQRSRPLDRLEAWLSTIAGTGALFVALFPTTRPGMLETDPMCGPDTETVPMSCTRLQQIFGENVVAGVHFFWAAIFILTLAAICLFVFAEREEAEGHHKRMRTHRVCGALILLALLWVGVAGVFQWEISGWTPLLVGEVVSIYAFSSSWMVRSYDLLSRPVAKGLKGLQLA